MILILANFLTKWSVIKKFLNKKTLSTLSGSNQIQAITSGQTGVFGLVRVPSEREMCPMNDSFVLESEGRCLTTLYYYFFKYCICMHIGEYLIPLDVM